MFVSLFLAATLTMKDVPPADKVSCYSEWRSSMTAKEDPRGSFEPSEAPPTVQASQYATPVNTTVSDSIGAPLRGARFFAVGRKGKGEFAVYDTSSGTLFICGHYTTEDTFSATRMPLARVPRGVPAHPLSMSFHTSKGIALGDSVAKIEAIYGMGKMNGSLTYTKLTKLDQETNFVTRTTFVFDDKGKLIGVERDAGI